jgi:enoyl-CoA hydratase/carnithine racemase
MPFLNIARDGAIWTLTMNQPETRNALTGNTAVDEFVQVCDEIRRDASVKAVILTGAGPIFSSGGNVKDMQRFFDDALTPDAIREEYRQGIHRIASETATFAESFVRVGIVPGDGGAWLLPRAVGRAKAAEMAFTGEAIDAREALACGLVSRVVPADQLLPVARALAGKIAANPGAVMRMTKRLLREGEHSSLESLLELSAGYQALAHKTADHREAVTAFVEKRKPRFQ